MEITFWAPHTIDAIPVTTSADFHTGVGELAGLFVKEDCEAESRAQDWGSYGESDWHAAVGALRSDPCGFQKITLCWIIASTSTPSTRRLRRGESLTS